MKEIKLLSLLFCHVQRFWVFWPDMLCTVRLWFLHADKWFCLFKTYNKKCVWCAMSIHCFEWFHCRRIQLICFESVTRFLNALFRNTLGTKLMAVWFRHLLLLSLTFLSRMTRNITRWIVHTQFANYLKSLFTCTCKFQLMKQCLEKLFIVGQRHHITACTAGGFKHHSHCTWEIKGRRKIISRARER